MAFFSLVTLVCTAQNDGQVFGQTIRIGGQKTLSGYPISWVDVSPDGGTVAASATQGFPFRFFPMDDPEAATGIDVGNWYAGSRARYSRSGSTCCCSSSSTWTSPQQATGPSSTRCWTAAGKAVRTFEDLYAADLTPDEATVLTLTRPGALRGPGQRQAG